MRRTIRSRRSPGVEHCRSLPRSWCGTHSRCRGLGTGPCGGRHSRRSCVVSTRSRAGSGGARGAAPGALGPLSPRPGRGGRRFAVRCAAPLRWHRSEVPAIAPTFCAAPSVFASTCLPCWCTWRANGRSFSGSSRRHRRLHRRMSSSGTQLPRRPGPSTLWMDSVFRRPRPAVARPGGPGRAAGRPARPRRSRPPSRGSFDRTGPAPGV